MCGQYYAEPESPDDGVGSKYCQLAVQGLGFKANSQTLPAVSTAAGMSIARGRGCLHHLRSVYYSQHDLNARRSFSKGRDARLKMQHADVVSLGGVDGEGELVMSVAGELSMTLRGASCASSSHDPGAFACTFLGAQPAFSWLGHCHADYAVTWKQLRS